MTPHSSHAIDDTGRGCERCLTFAIEAAIEAACPYAPTIRGMAKRGYSREFKPHANTGKRYLLDDIPAGLWSDVKSRAKREGISIRALILTLLREWVQRPIA